MVCPGVAFRDLWRREQEALLSERRYTVKTSYYAISILTAVGLSVAACGDRERTEEPLSRAPSESVSPAPAPRVGEAPGSPSATDQGNKDINREPGERKSRS
jgi:hypothetical protein